MTVQGVATHTLTRGAGQYLKRPPNASYFEAARWRTG